MHTLKDLSRSIGAHALPGVLLVVATAAVLCVWEARRLSGQPTGDRLGRLIVLASVVLFATSGVFIAAHFIWVA